MSYEVIATPRSLQTLESTYNAIEYRFGTRVADEFLDTVDRTIALIAIHPLMFKASSFGTNIRVGFITKQCSLLYKIIDNEVHLLFFWDDRQDPVFY